MFRKAERKKAKVRIGISGSSGSGKTYSALLVAFGLGGKVAFIDTENGSGDLYSHLGDYDIARITAPFTPEKYMAAIRAAEQAGYNVVIIDSLSHAWAGEGGLLEQQGKIADSGKNSFAAWRTITPKHNQLVETMLQSSCHIIATTRAKVEYAQDKDDKGKAVIKKLGMAPIQREGMEYEFTVFFDISGDHIATPSKDRTSMFDGQYFKPSTETGKRLREWFDAGKEEARQQEDNATASSKPKTTNYEFLKHMEAQKERVGEQAYYDTLGAHGFEHANEIADKATQASIYKKLVAMNEKGAA